MGGEGPFANPIGGQGNSEGVPSKSWRQTGRVRVTDAPGGKQLFAFLVRKGAQLPGDVCTFYG